MKKKNWRLFFWAFERLKIENGEYKKCLRNDILLELMDLSGVKPEDIRRSKE
jgi:hypothetical protein